MKRIIPFILVLIIALSFMNIYGEEPIIYKDEDANITFSVPVGWSQEELSKQRDFIDVKFKNKEVTYMSILFGATDIYLLMKSSGMEVSREMLCDDYFTKSEILDMYTNGKGEISEKTYNGTHYFVIVSTETLYTSGIPFSVTMTRFIHFENGFWYFFQFSGDLDNSLFADIEKLLESANYENHISAEKDSELLYEEPSDLLPKYTYDEPTKDEKTNHSYLFLIIGGIILALAVIAVIVVNKNKENKKYDICENCGIHLPKGSAFCHICGKKQKESIL